MSEYKLGDTVYLIHYAETWFVVKEVIERTLPVRHGADNNKMIAKIKLTYYHSLKPLLAYETAIP
jgi:hypothetical protein